MDDIPPMAMDDPSAPPMEDFSQPMEDNPSAPPMDNNNDMIMNEPGASPEQHLAAVNDAPEIDSRPSAPIAAPMEESPPPEFEPGFGPPPAFEMPPNGPQSIYAPTEDDFQPGAMDQKEDPYALMNSSEGLLGNGMGNGGPSAMAMGNNFAQIVAAPAAPLGSAQHMILNNNHTPTFIGVLPQNFNAKLAAKRVNDTLSKGWIIKDKDEIRRVLTLEIGTLNCKQRLELGRMLAKNHKINLGNQIRRFTVGPLRELLLQMTMNRANFHAKWIEYALTKKNVQMLTIRLCTLRSHELMAAHKAFNATHTQNLLKQITEQTSWWFFHTRNIYYFFENLLSKPRPKDDILVDMNAVTDDVLALSSAIHREKLDKQPFIKVFPNRSFAHLAQIAFAYRTMHEGKDLLNTIQKCFKEDSEVGYACFITLQFALSKYTVLTTLLKEYVSTPGAKYEYFSKLIVDRCEVDLGGVLHCYGAPQLQKWLTNKLKGKAYGYEEYYHVINMLCGFAPVLYPPRAQPKNEKSGLFAIS